MKKALAVCLIGVLTVVHLRGIEKGARIQNYLTVGKVALILVLILAGFATGRGEMGNLVQVQEATQDGADGGSWAFH